MGRVDGPTLVDDVLCGADPIWGLVLGLKNEFMNIFVVDDVGVVFGIGVLEEIVGDALTCERKGGKGVVEEGG